MGCLTCHQLTAEYELAKTRYAEARDHLKAFCETGSSRTYRAVKEFTDDARLEYELARMNWSGTGERTFHALAGERFW